MGKPRNSALGRAVPRRRYVCESCRVANAVGKPKSSTHWQLSLTGEQWTALLHAAAEYRDLTDEAGEYEQVVEFVDWLRPAAVEEAA